MLLSIAMIVKNEEKNIGKCLEALKGLKDKLDYEVIVVDTGSEDKTINIAMDYTEKVYEHKWENNFAEMRNRSIKYCKGDWILVLDADEVLEDVKYLIEFFNTGNYKGYNSATIKFKNMLSENKNDYLMGTLVRLFKNVDGFCYEGRVHEQPKITQPVALTNIMLTHYGYSTTSFNLMKYKYERNLKLLLKDLEDGKEPIYTYFQLAQTYGMANKNEKAFENITLAYNLVKKEDHKERYLYVYHFLAMTLVSKGNNEKAIEVAKEAIKYSNEHLDFYYILLKSYIALSKYDEASTYISKYFKLYTKLENGYIPEDISVNNNSYCKKDEVIKDKITVDFKLGKLFEIEEYYNKLSGLSDKNSLSEVYIYSLIKREKYSKVFEFYKTTEFEDKDIDSIISIVERIGFEELDKQILDIYTKLLGLNNNLDFYINFKYKGIKNNDYNVKYDGFAKYKGEIFKIAVTDSNSVLQYLEKFESRDQYNYINYMAKEYDCLNVLYDYSKENLLSSNINVLMLLVKVEDMLLRSNSIEENKYKALVNRSYINKFLYIKRIYKEEVLEDENYNKILKRDEVLWIQLKKNLKEYTVNKLVYVKGLRKILREYPEYKRLIELYIKEMDDKEITIEMKEEKLNILQEVQGLVDANMVGEAKSVLKEIDKIFLFDGDIKNALGVVEFFNGEIDDSLINIGLSVELSIDKFESLYNLAQVFENIQRNDEKDYYYKKALEVCSDINIVAEIKGIIGE
ncbi:MAG: glycosyltransferase family 2 protein [Clostridium sp.]|uniref:glycosyltransferase family 2 protein n=1 Tax=Clostridium sp. TaxID=1506 RepID=UPI00305E9B17